MDENVSTVNFNKLTQALTDLTLLVLKRFQDIRRAIDLQWIISLEPLDWIPNALPVLRPVMWFERHDLDSTTEEDPDIFLPPPQ